MNALAPAPEVKAPMQDHPSEKACKKCGVVQPLTDFARHTCNRDGRQGVCKRCDRERVADFAREYPEIHRARVKASQERNREAARKRTARYQKENPEKNCAKGRVRLAIDRGDLVKPSTCEDCGREFEDKRRLHAHHEDYSKPLEVRWLCPKCHRIVHARRIEGTDDG